MANFLISDLKNNQSYAYLLGQFLREPEFRRLRTYTAVEMVRTRSLIMFVCHVKCYPQKYKTNHLAHVLMKSLSRWERNSVYIWRYLVEHKLLLLNSHLANCAALEGDEATVKLLYWHYGIQCDPEIADELDKLEQRNEWRKDLRRWMHYKYNFPAAIESETNHYRNTSISSRLFHMQGGACGPVRQNT